MVSLKLFIGGMAAASLVGGAVGTGTSALLVPHFVQRGTPGLRGQIGPEGPSGPAGAQGPQGVPGVGASAYRIVCTTDNQGSQAIQGAQSQVVTGLTADCTNCPPHLVLGYLETTCSVVP